MRRLTTTLLVLAVATISTFAQTTSTFDWMDVFELQYASDIQISPNGEKIMYNRKQLDVMTDRAYSNLWIMDADGANHRAITSGKAGYRGARWSPSGDRIVYISGEEGRSQIFIEWMSNGKNSSITNEMNSPSNATWSPDGKWIAFTKFVPASRPSIGSFPGAPAGAEWEKNALVTQDFNFRRDANAGFIEQGNTHLFIVSAEGGPARQLSSGDFDHSAPEWTPDGSFLLFSANRSDDPDRKNRMNHIFEVSIKTGDIKQLTEGNGPYNSPTISPDGKSIVYLGYEDNMKPFRLDNLFIMNRDGSNKWKIEHGLDRELSNLIFAADGKSVFVLYYEYGDGKIAEIDLKGKLNTIVEHVNGVSYGRPYSGGQFSISKKGLIAYSYGTPEHPAEVSTIKSSGKGGMTRLTELNKNFFDGKTMGKVEEIWFNSSFDDKKVQGWIVYPPDFDPSQKYPLILEIHGGPWASYGPVFTPEIQLMASQGYVVLYTNPRGSTSYGEEFAAYINHNYPSEDYNDLMSGVDAVIDKGFIDESNLFITGGSGGGVLTSWSIGKTNRFKAAVVSKPVINWFSFALTADMKTTAARYWFEKMPWEDPDTYFKYSPISLVGNVETPTMVVVGENDYRTPGSESEQYYNALQHEGVESAFVRIQGAGHGLTARPSNMIRHVGYITGWFDKYRD